MWNFFNFFWSIGPQTTPYISHGIAQLFLHHSRSCWIYPAYSKLYPGISWASSSTAFLWVPLKCFSDYRIGRFSQCMAYPSLITPFDGLFKCFSVSYPVQHIVVYCFILVLQFGWRENIRFRLVHSREFN